MDHAFPPESVQCEREAVDTLRKFYASSRLNAYRFAQIAMNRFSEYPYGFAHNLRTGMYAHWPHEVYGLPQIANHNCTTVMAPLFLELEAFGITPQIVQFVNFRTKRRGDEGTNGNEMLESHFAVIANVGRTHPYLIDPFWGIFGPILEQREGYMRVGKTGKYELVERWYSRLVEYNPAQFRGLMDRLREPAESLDMLVAGQKVFSQREIEEVNKGKVMLYYDDHENVLTTRLYLPMQGTLDKVIFCEKALREDGSVASTSLRLSYARDSSWNALVGEKVLARTDYHTLLRMRRMLGKLRKNHRRIGPALQKSPNARRRRKLTELVDTLQAGLHAEEWGALETLVLVRTLYEHESPQAEYLSAQSGRDEHVLSLIQKEEALADRIRPLNRVDFRRGWRLVKYDPNLRGRARRKEKALNIRKNRLVRELDYWNRLRYHHRRCYDRLRDRLLYGKRWEGKSVDPLRRMVGQRGLDPRIGYAALVADFIPYTLMARQDLEQELFMMDIQQKVAVRREKKREAASV